MFSSQRTMTRGVSLFLLGMLAAAPQATAQYTCSRNTYQASKFTGGDVVKCNAVDQTSFEACITAFNSATAATIINMAAGSYLVKPFGGQPPLCFQGAGPSKTILTALPGSNPMFFLGGAGQLVGLTIDGIGNSGGIGFLGPTGIYDVVLQNFNTTGAPISVSSFLPDKLVVASSRFVRNAGGFSGVFWTPSGSTIELQTGVVFDSNIFTQPFPGYASALSMSFGSSIQFSCDTRMINQGFPSVNSGGQNTCAGSSNSIDCFKPNGCLYDYGSTNFTCGPCSSQIPVNVGAYLKPNSTKSPSTARPGQVVRLFVSLEGTGPASYASSAIRVDLPDTEDIVFQTKGSRTWPAIKPKSSKTAPVVLEGENALLWAPASPPTYTTGTNANGKTTKNEKITQKKNTRKYEFDFKVDKAAQSGSYAFDIAFQTFDADGILKAQSFLSVPITIASSKW